MNQVTLIAVCAVFAILLCAQTSNANPLTKRVLSSSRCFGDSLLSRDCYGSKRKRTSADGVSELGLIIQECRMAEFKAPVCQLAHYIQGMEERLAYAFSLLDEKDGIVGDN